MKLNFMLTSFVLLAVLGVFFSISYVYLHQADLVVVPSENGNPVVVLDTDTYFVRSWTLSPGCYRLTRIGFLGYNIATKTDAGRCGIQGD